MKQVKQSHVQMRSPIHSGGSTVNSRKNPREDKCNAGATQDPWRVSSATLRGGDTSDSQAKLAVAGHRDPGPEQSHFHGSLTARLHGDLGEWLSLSSRKDALLWVRRCSCLFS